MMKKLTLILFSLITMISAYSFELDGVGGDSGGPKQTWQDIMTNPSYRPFFPEVMIQGHSIGYNFVCLESDVVRTKYPIKVAHQDPTVNDFYFIHLYEDQGGDQLQCNSVYQGCYSQRIPKNLPILVYQVNNDDPSRFVPLAFIKQYQLPECDE